MTECAFTKPSRGTNEVRDERQSTETLSFRCWRERCRLTRGAAFTLAEVLITLAIIGIVAALTIPALTASYQKNITVSRLKRTYSLLNNALGLAKAEYGDMNNWDFGFGTTVDKSDPDLTLKGSEFSYNFFAKYLFPYMHVQKTLSGTLSDLGYKEPIVKSKGTSVPLSTKLYFAVLQDGSVFIMNSVRSSVFEPDKPTIVKFLALSTYVDMNGSQPPNVIGKDVFRFTLPLVTKTKWVLHTFISVDTAKWESFVDTLQSREDILNNCKNYEDSCGALIQYDGWKISDDYPIKF